MPTLQGPIDDRIMLQTFITECFADLTNELQSMYAYTDETYLLATRTMLLSSYTT